MARRLASALLGLVALGWPALAAAQLRRETEPVMLPPLSVSAPEGPFALAANPAALTGLSGWNLAYLHVAGPNDDEARDRGDAGYFAMPLPFGLAAGLSIEHLRGGPPFAASTHVTVGAAYGHTPRFATGFAVRHIEGGSVDGATTVDLALLVRRSRFFAFSLVGKDLLGPAGLVGLDGLTVPAVALGAFTLRPLGNDHLTLEGFGAVATDGRVGFGGFASIGLPRGGRLAARTTIEHFRFQREMRVVFGAELPWDQFSAFGGAVLGDAYSGNPGWYTGAIAGERPVMSLPGLKVVHELVVRGQVDTRRVLGLVTALQRAAHDPRIGGVLVKMAHPELPWTHAQELRQAIETVRASGKPVACWLESSELAEVYACAASNRVWLAPGARVSTVTPTVDVVSLERLLERAGIESDVVALGARGPEANEAIRVELTNSALARLRADLARSLGVAPEEADAFVAAGPYDTRGAIESPLADGSVHRDEIDDALASVIDGRVRRRRRVGPFGARAWARPRRVAVVILDGPLADEEHGERLSSRIGRLARDPSIGAIVLRVDSSGGSWVAAERVWTALNAARDRKPLVASIGERATSGAYLLASACDEVFANPSSVAGGLALVFARVALDENEYQPFTPDERDSLEARLELAQRVLMEKVAMRRELDERSIGLLGGGRLVSGDEALRSRLIDHLGGFIGAVARAREIGRVAPNVELAMPPAEPRPQGSSEDTARELAEAIARLDQETALAIPPAIVVTP